ncbi:TatD family hydrolase [Lacticaseibacillus camelliae]|uniref:Mg-dependent dnase, tatd family protein n=1 Tax=Lacticaseibacillus camelliae DSM 22697 = JCM 13995 TaxID=1423730 RepID=A0A0R2FBR7_9LACO|nr:TatD family hydrolase [Lacticaseibacillus camelliae]KRN25919.1 mg-dependent dnase, tatd family protein [Lacticaseibacillus camelliae DSM 22697 = JCM 13995]
MQIFDTHTHLNDTPYAGKEAEYVEAAKRLGVEKMAIVGSNAALNAGTMRLSEQFEHLYAIVGWHPDDSKDYDQAAEKLLEAQLAAPKTIALGEIGLDYHWDNSPREIQRRVFRRQLAIARELHLPVSIHSRDAFEDSYPILKEAHVGDFGGIMHSFTGDAEWARRFLDLGMYISYSGIVSFKNAPLEHASVRVVPDDRLLAETDAPYLTPTPYRGRQNQPAYTRYVVEAEAKYRDDTPEHIAALTWANAHRIFGLKETE